MKVTQTSQDSPGHTTERELSKLQLSPSKQRIVKRKLLFANVHLHGFKFAKNNTASKKKILHMLIAGNVARKCRCINTDMHSRYIFMFITARHYQGRMMLKNHWQIQCIKHWFSLTI
jgi:hypothetical protein